MMTRNLLIAALAFVFALPAPLAAQMTFEGFDLSEDKEDEKKEEAKPVRKKRRRPKRTRRAPAATETQDATASTEDDFGLDLSGDDDGGDIEISIGGGAVKKEDEDKLSFEGFALGEEAPEAGEAEKQALDAALNLVKAGDHEAAAVAFHKMLENPKAAAHYQQAEYLLAKSLYKMGMYHSSLEVFNSILAAGEAHKYFKVSLEWLFFISRKTVNESVVLEDIAAQADQAFPDKYKDEFQYLLAKYYFARGRALVEAERTDEAQVSFDESVRLLGTVSAQTKFYPKARFLEGLMLYQSGRPNEALERFKDVVRILNPRKGAQKNRELRDLAFMQLARLHYEHGQNRHAVFYYDKIDRGSDQWLQAMFESSWSWFRMADFERSLGNMVTLHSPFFSDEYYPESLILKAVIYFENCRYPEAKAIVDEFERVYGPVQAELSRLAASGKTPSEYYEMLAEAQKGSGTTNRVLQRILKAALTDKEFESMNDSIREIEAELDSIAGRKQVFKFSGLAKTLIERLKEERRAMMQKAGLVAAAKLYAEMESLKELIGQGLRIRFETTTKEKEFLEMQLQAGGRLDVVKEYGFSVAVSDEELYWPYEGEYWRDELGTYQYTLTKGCHERLRASKE